MQEKRITLRKDTENGRKININIVSDKKRIMYVAEKNFHVERGR